MGWYASEDGFVHVPTRRDFLDRYKTFLTTFDNILGEVERGGDFEKAKRMVCDDTTLLRNHPESGNLVLRDEYFLDELERSYNCYLNSPRYFGNLAEKRRRKQIAEQRERSADCAMWAAAALAAVGWGIELTRHQIAPGLERIITAENIRLFCGVGASTLFVAALMNYWESKNCG